MKKTPPKTPTGQFKKGSSGNPTGRPAGSRNKSTLASEELLEGQAEKLTQKAVEMALKGNVHAMKLCLERISPPRKDRLISLESRPIKTLNDLLLQFQDIVRAITEGKITPAEGESVFNILAAFGPIMEKAEMDRRLGELETSMEIVKAYKAELAQFLKDGGLGVVKKALQ